MWVKIYIRQVSIVCLVLTVLMGANGCSSWDVMLGGTVVPAVKNYKLTLYPSGITWTLQELHPGVWGTLSYGPAAKVPSKAFVEFDDEFGTHHSLAASCRIPWYFDGRIFVLVTRKENLGKTGNMLGVDTMGSGDSFHGKGCNFRADSMQKENEENYDEDYLLKVYFGDKQDFCNTNKLINKLIYSLQRDDEHCVSNVIFLVRDIPEAYEIKQRFRIESISNFSDIPITSVNGMRARQIKTASAICHEAKGELFWRHNYISLGPLRYVDIDISENGAKTIKYHTADFGFPDNFRGDIALFLLREGDSYQLRIFVDNLGSLVAYKDYHSLCQALDERYERFPRQDVRFDYGPSGGGKDREGNGMSYLIDCR